MSRIFSFVLSTTYVGSVSNANAKVSPQVRGRIWKRCHLKGTAQRELAGEYGLPQDTVSEICRTPWPEIAELIGRRRRGRQVEADAHRRTGQGCKLDAWGELWVWQRHHAGGDRVADLATEYDVSRMTIYTIVNRTWAEVKERLVTREQLTTGRTRQEIAAEIGPWHGGIKKARWARDKGKREFPPQETPDD